MVTLLLLLLLNGIKSVALFKCSYDDDDEREREISNTSDACEAHEGNFDIDSCRS